MAHHVLNRCNRARTSSYVPGHGHHEPHETQLDGDEQLADRVVGTATQDTQAAQESIATASKNKSGIPLMATIPAHVHSAAAGGGDGGGGCGWWW